MENFIVGAPFYHREVGVHQSCISTSAAAKRTAAYPRTQSTVANREMSNYLFRFLSPAAIRNKK